MWRRLKLTERGGSIESCKGGDERMKVKTINKFLLVIIILMLLIVLSKINCFLIDKICLLGYN